MSARAADRPDARVRIERVFAAPRELVFDAWTQRELLLQWYAPHGCTVHIASIDVRPERIVYTLATADGEGNEIEPVQAGHDPRWPRQTVVSVTLAEVPGGTKLTLEQTVSEALARHTGAHPSWLQMLDRLDSLVGTGQAANA